jgi:hypothetical protein
MRGLEIDINENGELPTKADEIRVTINEFSEHRGQKQLNELQHAMRGTGIIKIDNLMDKLENWLARKRPSSGGKSLEAEIVSAIASIRRCASDYHSLPASARYRNRVKISQSSVEQDY